MRLIDADALKAEWYRLNNVDEEDRGARFVGYHEIPRLIDNAPTVEPGGDYISRADAKRAVLDELTNDAALKEIREKPLVAISMAVVKALNSLPSAEAVQGRK